MSYFLVWLDATSASSASVGDAGTSSASGPRDPVRASGGRRARPLGVGALTSDLRSPLAPSGALRHLHRVLHPTSSGDIVRISVFRSIHQGMILFFTRGKTTAHKP